MNYITQMNGFRLRRKLSPLPSMAIALYYIILENFNQVGFPDTLEIPIGILSGELSVSDNSVRKARQVLFDSGYIYYENGKSKRAAIYQLVDLDPRFFAANPKENAV